MPEPAEHHPPLPPEARRWAQVLTLALPLLCVLGPYASLLPGASGFPYFYRLAVAALLLGSLPLVTRRVWRDAAAPTALTWLAALWLAWTTLSLAWSPNRGTGLVEVVASGAALTGAWVLMLVSRGRADAVARLRRGWYLGAGAVAVIGLLEVATGRHTLSLVGGHRWVFRQRTVSATFANPNGLAIFGAAVFLLAATALIRGGSRRAQALAVVAVPVAGYLILASGGRAGLYAFTAAGLAAGLAALPSLHRSWVPYLLVAAAVALPVAASTGVGEWRPPAAERVIDGDPDTARNPENALDRPGSSAQRKREYTAKADAMADRQRMAYTRLGVSYLRERPVQGHGAGGAVWRLEHDPRRGRLPVVPLHNSLLQVAVNFGLVLAVPVVGAVLVVLWSLLRGLRWRDREDLALRLEGAGLVGIVGVASIGLSSIYNEPAFLALLGHAAACAWVVARRTRARRAAQEVPA